MNLSGVKQIIDESRWQASGQQLPEWWGDWREQLRRRIGQSGHSLPYAVTPYYAALIDHADANCPIARQVVPSPAENEDRHFTDPDPLCEESHSPLPGLTHRYPDRLLWYLHDQCASYCRFCLRRRKVASRRNLSNGNGFTSRLDEVVDYIGQMPAIREVILSGGDPLLLSDQRLGQILSGLRTLPQLISLRIHSRVPATLPMRITAELATTLERHFPLTIVCHFNHPRELTAEAALAARRLRMAGVQLLNQSVLLRHINDTAEIQSELLLGLLRLGIKPYYLHLADEVAGTAHFRTRVERGLEILRQLQGRVPGIAIPRFVADLPGGGGKVPLENSYILSTQHEVESTAENGATSDRLSDRLIVESYNGREHQLLNFEL